jgi:hypothetical protein
MGGSGSAQGHAVFQVIASDVLEVTYGLLVGLD